MLNPFSKLLIINLMFLLSCEVSTKKDLVTVTEVQLIDTLAVLNSFNSDEYLVKGTVLFEEVVAAGNFIKYDVFTRKKYLIEINDSKFDSIFYAIEKDTLFISNVISIIGRSGDETFAYLEYDENKVFLKTPILSSGHFEIYGGDTLLFDDDGCDCAGAIEQRFKIPLSKIENAKHLFFKGQEILFE